MSQEPAPADQPTGTELTFDPVPRKVPRHDGWTPERQRALIAALADTGSVTQACRIVNMHPDHAYGLRRHAEGASFRAAWDAALRLGVERLKGEAFDRALNGQLKPVFVAGKLVGYRRVKSDTLLMFCLRYYGDAAPKRETTVNYVSTGAAPGYARAAAPGLELAPAEPNTVVRRIADQRPTADAAAATLGTFAGVPLDAQADAAIRAALDACATRRRATMPEDDAGVSYIAEQDTGDGFAGELEFGGDAYLEEPFVAGEASWRALGDSSQGDATETLAARAALGRSQAHRDEIEEGDERMVVAAAQRLATGEIASLPPVVEDMLKQGRGVRALDRSRKGRKPGRYSG